MFCNTGDICTIMDFADATLIVTAEKTGIREIISLDKDFNIYQLPGKEKIYNIFP